MSAWRSRRAIRVGRFLACWVARRCRSSAIVSGYELSPRRGLGRSGANYSTWIKGRIEQQPASAICAPPHAAHTQKRPTAIDMAAWARNFRREALRSKLAEFQLGDGVGEFGAPCPSQCIRRWFAASRSRNSSSFRALAMTMASSCCARSRSRAIAPSSVAKPHSRASGQNSDTWYPAHRSARGGGRVKSHHPYENKQSCCS